VVHTTRAGKLTLRIKESNLKLPALNGSNFTAIISETLSGEPVKRVAQDNVLDPNLKNLSGVQGLETPAITTHSSSEAGVVRDDVGPVDTIYPNKTNTTLY